MSIDHRFVCQVSHVTEHPFPDEAPDVTILVLAGARDCLEGHDRAGEPRPDQPVLLRLDHHNLKLFDALVTNLTRSSVTNERTHLVARPPEPPRKMEGLGHLAPGQHHDRRILESKEA